MFRLEEDDAIMNSKARVVNGKLNSVYLEWIDKAASQLVLKPLSKEDSVYTKDLPTPAYLGFLENIVKKTITYKDAVELRHRESLLRRKSRTNSSVISHLKKSKEAKNSSSTRDKLKKTGLESTTMDTTFPSIMKSRRERRVSFRCSKMKQI